MRKRYSIGKFHGVKHITDNTNGRVFAYGWNVELLEYQQHRHTYTGSDAKAVVDWMNERAAGYPPRLPLPSP